MDADRIELTECVGMEEIQTGNTDLTCEREAPRPDPVKHLPGHEHSRAIATAGWELADLAFYAIAALGICMGVFA